MVKNRCLKITVETDPVMVDSIGDFLIGVFEAGVETGARDEALYGVINGYIQGTNLHQEEVEGIIDRISTHLAELATIFNVVTPRLSATVIEEEDWGKSWKKHFKPFCIVPGMVITPTWEKYQPCSGELVITMDPGMAFGTGHHATTSLTLEFLQELLAGTTELCLLDVGTGTGILGMAAVLFGVTTAYGIDNDPDAIVVAAGNVNLNGMQDSMEVSCTPLGLLKEYYPVIVANIVHDVLVEMMEDFARLTEEEGILILSGLLTGKQVKNVIEKCLLKGFVLLEQKNKEEWSALKFVKRTRQ